MERLYCGDKETLPPGYTGYATRFRCLRKGVGIGLYKIRNQQRQGQGVVGGAVGGRGPPPCVQRAWWSMVPWWAWTLMAALVVVVIVLVCWSLF
jgi:hypothetical protein